MGNSLDSVFQGIYKSIVEAQNTIEQHYVGEIKEDYFDKEGNPYMVPVKLPHGQNGEMKTINIPVITLVPHNGMAIKEVEIEMKVALSPGESEEINKNDVKDNIIEEFKSQDKDIRILTYRVLLEKFNDKYSHLSDTQKSILKEFINNVDSTNKLKEFYNLKVHEIKKSLQEEIKSVRDNATKIKLTEINKFIVEIDKNKKINSDNLVDLLQYCNLLEELKSTHEPVQV